MSHVRRIVIFILLFGLLSPHALASVPALPMGLAPQLVLEDGTILNINRIDEGRGEDEISVHTSVYGSLTAPFDPPTVEFIIVNDIVAEKNAGDLRGTYIPANGYVISAMGEAIHELSTLEVGQKVQRIGWELPAPAPANYFQVKDNIIPIDHINTSRKGGAVVLYQPSFGPTTQTNPWGMEITVQNGQVTNIATLNDGENNSPIPQEGYVLSVHVDSRYYTELSGLVKVKVGDPVTLVLKNDLVMYEAGQTLYHAYNPKTKEDNPAGWNEEEDAPYPGFRGANQLIVYDSYYGETTGTNGYGYEVMVNRDHIVVKSGGNNSSIPEGGWVLSGHGIMADWLQKYARVGAKLQLDRNKKEAVTLFTPRSYLAMNESKLREMVEMTDQSQSRFLDIPYSEITSTVSRILLLRGEMEEAASHKDYDLLTAKWKEAEDLLRQVYYLNFESRKVEHRGIWLRPMEKNREEVRQHVAAINDANFNQIYLETWWSGYSIFPAAQAMITQNPIYNGFDVLEAYIEEAHELGIEVHAWVENYYVGKQTIDQHPDWSLLSRKGDPYYLDESGTKYYWINPAMPEVSHFLSGIYEELLNNYEVDGLHLDYIRYPQSGDFTNDFGYDPYTRSLFMERYDTDPIELYPGDSLWMPWVQFRADFINDFVERIAAEAKNIKPAIAVSASVSPHFEEAPQERMQQARAWVENNQIDNLFPMSYKQEVQPVVTDARNALDLARDYSYVTIGVGTVYGISETALLRQIDETNKTGTSGSAIFEYRTAHNYLQAIKNSVYRNKAIVPFNQPKAALTVVLEDVSRKIEDIYVPLGGMENGKKYSKQVAKLLHILQGNDLNPGKATALQQNLNKMLSDIDHDSEINRHVKERMSEDLHYALKMIQLFLKKSN
ncbi:glycoside hydrolase family 10 protein [Paenibacillus sp. J2TS4]|uniref:glycoside hydrolase family 10 protein n=1 Tax=Paenibacillus sp. J2TS4 TaxID=2807194 RepID=UPI001B2E7A63|nr:family 10 glycosylhydrolase [Paenibacillus sp. J2TS4]GIP34209.1 hypothetical protein J2TS4_34190 [Paenibacillus sp. J2TS4]